jgi:hypothetical protein
MATREKQVSSRDEIIRLGEVLKQADEPLVINDYSSEKQVTGIPDGRTYTEQNKMAVTREWISGWNACRALFSAAPVEPVFPERDPSIPTEQQGLFRKFDVRRVDGSDRPGGKHEGCRYYVLDLDHDQHAPAAMRTYAAECKSTHPQLAADIEAEFGAAPVEPVVTEEMVTAYLAANTEYWRQQDELPSKNPSKWRNGTPKEATRMSLEAALRAAPLSPSAAPVEPVAWFEQTPSGEWFLAYSHNPNAVTRPLYFAAPLSPAPDTQEIRNQALEEAAKHIENGSFLHLDSPAAQLAKQAAKAIRALKTAPLEQEDRIVGCRYCGKRMRESKECWNVSLSRGCQNEQQHPCALEPDAGSQPAITQAEQDKRDAERYRTIRSLLNAGPEAEAALENVLTQVFPVNEERNPTPEQLDAVVDGVTAAFAALASSRVRDASAKSPASHSQKGVSLNTPNNGSSVLSDSGDTSIRKDFEAWAKKQYCGFKLSDFIETLGCYMDDPTQCAWLGYQAGRSDSGEQE